MSAVLTKPAVVGAGHEPRPRRWTVEEFYRMAELGLFHCQRAELLDGEIMVLSPQGPSHSFGIDQAFETLRRCGWPDVWVRSQFPINFDPYSEPEPDISVVEGTAGDYKNAHPTTALLIVEVSDSTLAYDRGRKASLYARMGILDYWIINLWDGQLEVRRDPVPDTSQRYGYGYASLAVLGESDSIVPLAAPNVRIAVTDLLP